MKKLLIATFALLISVSAHAGDAGGVGDGGGNSNGANLDYAVIRQTVESSKLALRVVFQTRELWTKQVEVLAKSPIDIAPLEQDLKLLFGGQVTIYQAIDQAKFNFLAKGPCLDKAGNAVDSSAVNPPEVCISLERLALKLRADNVESELVPLLAYEVSQFVGASESEASNTQENMRKSTPNDIEERAASGLARYSANLDVLLKGTAADLAQIVQTAKQKDWSAIPASLCADLQNGFDDSKMTPFVDDEGISILTDEQVRVISGAAVKAENIYLSVCPASTDKKAMAQVKIFAGIFGKKLQMALQDFFARDFVIEHPYASKEEIVVPINGPIRKIDRGDYATLKTELSEYNDMLKQVSGAMIGVPPSGS